MGIGSAEDMTHQQNTYSHLEKRHWLDEYGHNVVWCNKLALSKHNLSSNQYFSVTGIK